MKKSISLKEYLDNFPHTSFRNNQDNVIGQICEAFNSGCKYVILEAPTGFGKSAIAMTAARTLGSSFVCTATKDLQTQYTYDYGFLKVAKGKNNFQCRVKEDFMEAGKYLCNSCNSGSEIECRHTSCDYGPCLSDESMEGAGCRYRTFINDYNIDNKGRKNERIFIGKEKLENYETEYSNWIHLRNFDIPLQWSPCYYFDQLFQALKASHSIFNYSIFLSLIANKNMIQQRELLVLDEAHLLETEIIKFRGLSISKKRWRRYLSDFKMIDYGFDLNGWLGFLIDLEKTILILIGYDSLVKSLVMERKIKYGYDSKSKAKSKNKRIVSASELFEDDKSLELDIKSEDKKHFQIDDELLIDIVQDIDKLTRTINNILSNPKNWIVSEVYKENYDVLRVEFKPLDASKYIKNIVEKCPKTLIMSATILDYRTFEKNLGLDIESDRTKFIQIQSDFPIENRPIFPLSVEYLNFSNLQQADVKTKISRAIDNIMHIHSNDKGIIHTTSYEQLNFIKENLSKMNSRRLILTDPEIQRDEVIREHIDSKKPTVLISPSLHTGLDLKDNLSRFQIITKVPYPNIADKWTSEKRKINEEWYYWQTALRLVQAYGRSIRSKDDWAKTYVLDAAFNYFVKMNVNILPKWFVSAIRTER
ncbi:MAG TPA: ATP-dependent DNA helicase [Nitrososphaeraceae archaeon]|nr:ATP-dependent DNA helicase [Nitrososphaeraceae archaeon]